MREWTAETEWEVAGSIVQGQEQNELEQSHRAQNRCDRGNANGVSAIESEGVGVQDPPRSRGQTKA